MKKKIESVVKFAVYLSFFVPLVVIPSSFIFPFIVPKILLFRSLATVMLAGYVLLLIINWQEYRPRFTILNLIVLAFLASFAISTFVGVDPYHSFWDNHERMLGLFTVFHYIAYYFICSSVFKDWKQWQLALRIFLIAGSIVSFIGLMQVVNPQLLLNRGGGRVISTLGNAIYLGGYGLFLSFVAFLLAIREKSSFWRWFEVSLGLLAILAMFFSGTRGSMLGFLAGVGVALIGYIIILKGYTKTRRILWAVIFLGLLLLGVLYGFRESNFVRSIPAVGRALNTSVYSVTNSPRWIAWEIGVDSWKEHFIFGWGPNNFFYAFNEHYNPKLLLFGYGETWFDNAHNVFVNTLAVQGLFGLVVYLSIFIFGILSVWKAYKHDDLNKHLVVIGTAFLVAHLVQNITVFENPTSYLYFVFWLALLNQQSLRKVSTPKNNKVVMPNRNKNVSMSLISFLAVFAFLVIFIFNIQPARANMKTLATLKTIPSNPLLAVTSMKQSLEFSSPHIDDIRSDIGRVVNEVLGANYEKIGKERSLEILDVSYNSLLKNLQLHPLDIRNQLILVRISQLKTMINKDARYLLDAEKFAKDALSRSPKRQQIIYNLANTQLQLGKQEDAFNMLKRAIDDNSKVGESYWRLAYFYQLLNMSDKVKEVIELADKNNAYFDGTGKVKIKEISDSLKGSDLNSTSSEKK